MLRVSTNKLIFGAFAFLLGATLLGEPYQEWSLSRAVKILNNSSWARQETFTQILGGIGSGIQGEKEIYNTFFVRFLSAIPVREAFARIKQIHLGYDQLGEREKSKIDQTIKQGLEMDVSDWIVVAVTFRSNNPSQEARVSQFFQSQTNETMRNRAYLYTERFPKLQISAYYPPRDKSVGAKFVFPRSSKGIEVVSPEDATIAFELFVPGAEPQLRATFQVKEMIVEGKLVL